MPVRFVRCTSPVGEARLPESALPHLGGGDFWVPVADQPAQSAKKKEWVEYAVARGVDREQAEQLTKSELIDQLA